MSVAHLGDPALELRRDSTLRPAMARRAARRVVELGAGVALATLAAGLMLAARLAFAARTWPELHDALHRLLPTPF